MNSFDELFSKLREETEIPTKKKAEMVADYFNIYQEKIHTTTQHSEELQGHIAQLEKIGVEKEYYRNLLLQESVGA